MLPTRAALLCSAALATAAFAQEALSPPPLPLPAESEWPTAALPRPIRSVRGVARFEYSGQPVVGFRLESSVRKSLVIPGSIMFGVAWLFTGFTGISINPLAFVPVVGALALTAQVASPTPRGGFTDTLGALGVAMFVATGVVQLLGVGLFVLGLAMPQLWLERDLGDVHVALAPSPFGANVVARF
jgi:hypothetical protein